MEPEGEYASYLRSGRRLAPYWKHKSTASITSNAARPASPTNSQCYTYSSHSERSNTDMVKLQRPSNHLLDEKSLFVPSSSPAKPFLSDDPTSFRETACLAQQQQEQEDFEFARKLMDEPTTVVLSEDEPQPNSAPCTVTGKALAFAHAIREAIEQQHTDDQSRLVSVVDGTVIHATTERLLNLQKQIMRKNDHLFNKTFDIEPHYNSEDEESQDEMDSENGENLEAGEASVLNADDAVTGHDQIFAAVQAEASELIDICFGACDASGRIIKFSSPATFGRGVYTSNTPFSPIFFSQPQASKMKLIIMARLKGKAEYISPYKSNANTIRGQTDSAVLVTPGTADEICILRRSSQCIPLLIIRQESKGSGRPVLDYDDDDAVGNDIVHRYVCLLQRLVEQLLHDKERHSPTIPQRVLPSEVKGDTDPSDISSFQVANRSLAPAMKRWSLRTVAYYTCPETIDERAFCIPTPDKLEQILLQQTIQSQNQTAKCGVCFSAKGGNLKMFPKCRHAFHIQCLTRRWSKGKCFRCPTCNLSIQFRQTAVLDNVEKDQALILNFRIGDSSKAEETKDSAQRHCQSRTAVVTAIIPVLSEALSPTSAENALTIKYDCGSSFQLKLADVPIRPTTTVTEQWSSQFYDPSFLLQIQNRVKAHSTKCSVCQRRQEGRLRSNLLRYVVPRHSPNENAGKEPHRVFIGTMPSGTMRVDELPDLSCSGHSPGIFLIKYDFADGVQKPYHKSPGEPFTATCHESFLPNCPPGRLLLERLILAFTYGLTFTIGSSTTTGERTVVKWSTIPHKTSLSPGKLGFPDISYFDAAHAELDSLGVPRVSDLQ